MQLFAVSIVSILQKAVENLVADFLRVSGQAVHELPTLLSTSTLGQLWRNLETFESLQTSNLFCFLAHGDPDQKARYLRHQPMRSSSLRGPNLARWQIERKGRLREWDAARLDSGLVGSCIADKSAQFSRSQVGDGHKMARSKRRGRRLCWRSSIAADRGCQRLAQATGPVGSS
ncbi:hypothetical protein KCU93_g20, partial [Aureobasidium melanogenum]